MRKDKLIKLLQEIPGNPIIVKPSDNFELRGSLIESESKPRLFNAKKKKETFYDGFDYESYEKEIIVEDESGKIKCIRL